MVIPDLTLYLFEIISRTRDVPAYHMFFFFFFEGGDSRELNTEVLVEINLLWLCVGGMV